MRWARQASVSVALAGLMLAPFSLFAQVGFPVKPGQTVSPSSSSPPPVQLEVPKVREPEPYTPPPARCMRWKGKAFLSRYNGAETACLAGCVLQLEDVDGPSARWGFTGARCQGRGREVASDRVAQAVGAPGTAETPIHQDHPMVKREPRPPALKGQALNYGDAPRDSPPPGYRAARR